MTNLQTLSTNGRCTVEALPPLHISQSVQSAVRTGLSAHPKRLPPFLLYDHRGSNLFEEICRLPEYYLTRTEQSILESCAPELVARFSRDMDLVEFGSGSSTKTRTLLDALFSNGHRPTYRPVDISHTMLNASTTALVSEYPELMIKAIVSDYGRGLEEISRQRERQKVFLFLGSNLGNFTPREAVDFLAGVRRAMTGDDLLLLGVDLVKPLAVLLPAYDDAAGVTAAFNRNLLVRLNRELGADFRPECFRHEVRWNQEVQAVEMHLASEGDQVVSLPAIDLKISFLAGETIHTESSHKYTSASLAKLCAEAGLAVERSWSDPQNWFALNMIVPS
ncbi:MAG: L-histidine N(alpha)-methyltransferase [Candidatus Marinimicrobia bacterium]|nr:L-histidine N(alpha)-methyltransferase [Candidatus Neomarinimicrobiota bacterium]